MAEEAKEATKESDTSSGSVPTGVATSSDGPNGPFPEELRSWNWGAFLLSWIWAIGHNVWLGLLALVPYIGVIMVFILGFKGNEWAWQHRKFESVEQFKAVERAWTKAGVIVFVISLVVMIATAFLAVRYGRVDTFRGEVNYPSNDSSPPTE